MKFMITIDTNAEESVSVVVNKKNSFIDDIENLVRNYSGENEITVYSENEFFKLNFENVECIFVMGGKTELISADGKHYFIKERLYEIEQLLPGYFVKINKSAIANERAISRFKSDFGGGMSVEFKCGYSDYVSRRCFAEIKRRMKR